MRIRRMAYSTVGTVLGLLVGQAILGDRWTIIVVVSVLSLAGGVVAAIGASWSLLSLNALVYVAIATAEPLGRPLWFPALLALAGAGWALALSIPGWVVKRDEPERMAVAGAYQAIAALAEYYQGSPFVQVLKTAPRIKDVATSNYAHLSAVTNGSSIAVMSVLDNLTKGAAGGGMQWMNRLLGFDESTGLTAAAPGWT